MILEAPQPPTAPAPAIRPKPPTPPRLDKAPFVKEKSVDSPEEMARDAVAHGSGALTKRTVDKNNEQSPPANQTVTVIPPDTSLVEDSQSDYDRGQDVLREFRDMDVRESQATFKPTAQTSTEQPRTSTPSLNHQDGHGGAFWIFTIIFVAVASFLVARKFLFTEKPALTKSQLFDEPSKSKATPDIPPQPKPAVKPARIPEKKSDDKPKHFEIRV